MEGELYMFTWCRPASTSRLHRDANSVGTPARPNEAADDLAAGLDDYFFLLLTPSKAVSAPSRTPIQHLTIGTILGAGMEQLPLVLCSTDMADPCLLALTCIWVPVLLDLHSRHEVVS